MQNKRIIWFWFITAGIFIVLILVSYNSRQLPAATSSEQAAKRTVKAYQSQDILALQTCYGKDIDILLADTEITFERKFYLAVGAEKLSNAKTEQLLEISDYMYVGLFFEFIMSSGETVPYYDYLITHKEKDGSFKVVTVKDTPREVLDYFEENSDNASKSRLHESFLKSEEKYIAAYPETSDGIYREFELLMDGIPSKLENNMRSMSIIFLMAIIQLWALAFWVYKERGKKSMEKERLLKTKIRERLQKK